MNVAGNPETEEWDGYDENGALTGEVFMRGEPVPDGRRHLVCAVCILDPVSRRMLVQKRTDTKIGYPGRWDISAGGSALKGETSRKGMRRELMEELGIDIDFSGTPPRMRIYADDCFVDVYVITRRTELSEICMQESEVYAVRWAGIDEIQEMIRDGSFVPYNPDFIRFVFSLGDGTGIHIKE